MRISPHTAAFLQGLGHDAVHVHAQGLDRLENSAVLDKARELKLFRHTLTQA